MTRQLSKLLMRLKLAFYRSSRSEKGLFPEGATRNDTVIDLRPPKSATSTSCLANSLFTCYSSHPERRQSTKMLAGRRHSKALRNGVPERLDASDHGRAAVPQGNRNDYLASFALPYWRQGPMHLYKIHGDLTLSGSGALSIEPTI